MISSKLFYKRVISFTVSVLLFSTSVLAQKYSDKADKYFDKNLFNEAIQLYKLESKSGNAKSMDYALQKLADCYRITGQFGLAEETYKKILKKKKKDPKSYLNYGQALKSSAKYAEAAIQFKEYIKLSPADPMGKIYLQSCDSAQKWLEETIGNEVRNVEKINTPLNDFAPVFFSSDKLFFSSSRVGSKEALVSLNGGIEVHRLDLYDVDVNSLEGETKADVENFSAINTPLHEGPACFSADGKELYFTRTIKGKKDKSTNKVLNTLQVFYCCIDSTGKWSKPVSAFTFNSSEYSVGQPSLSADGKIIYFMSDMPGGYGGTDIYYCSKQKDATWSKPVNIGNKVNTFGHELFPYISDNGILYFSSDTHPGMGQLDIFSSKFIAGEWTSVLNLKPPINSIANDFGIALDQKYLRGFFSSDRFNGKGLEDIYSFSEVIPLKLTVNGGLIQFPDKSIFDGIKYKLIDEKTKAEINLESQNGIYSLDLLESQNYTLVAKKNGFGYNKVSINLLRDTLGKYLEVKLKTGLRPIWVNGYIVSKLTSDTSGSKESPVERISVSLIDSTTTIEKKLTGKGGFFEFEERLDGHETYTVIAKIEVPKDPPDPVVKCKGLVEYKGQPLSNASVQLLEEGKPIERMMTDDKGNFNFTLDVNKKYTVVANKTGFNTNESTFTTSIADAKSGLSKVITLDSLGNLFVNGIVKDAAGPVKDAQLVIRDAGEIVGEVRSSSEGTFNYALLPERVYTITANANGYLQKEITISTKNSAKGSVISAELFLDSIKVNSVVELKNLYYDYNKPDVQFASLPALDKLVEFMKANPNVSIELAANTDSRGNPEYNLKLSQARAQYAKDYLTLEDIDQTRVLPVGHGKNNPIIANAKSENEHQVNRRTEIRIIKK